MNHIHLVILHHVSLPQKDGTFRPITDFRRIIEVTLNEHYPSPVLSDCFVSLGRGNTFSSLDLLSGYWQVELAPALQEILVFITPSGHYD